VRMSLNLAESRSQVGIPRSVVSEHRVGETNVRDTTVAVALQRGRNTTISSTISVKLGPMDVRTSTSYRENLRTNTASADDALHNTYFGKDRRNRGWAFDTAVSGKVSKALVARSALRYSNSEERFLPVRLPGGGVFRDPSSDLGDGDLFLNGSLDWQAASKHSLKLSAYVELKTENNPGAPEQNRNISSNSVSLTYDGVTAGKTAITARVERKYYHRINLDATRAADNLRNRDLTLSVNTRYQRLGISFSHAFNISARRTIYDFDRVVNGGDELRKSNIRRGWSMVHTVRRQLLKRIQVNGRYAYSADDFGTLLVENGAQIVEEDNSDHRISVGLSYSPTRALSASASYSYGLDRQWEHTYRHRTEERYLNRRNKSETFSMSTNYKSDAGTTLVLRGSRSRQLSGVYDSFTVTYSRPL